MAENYQPVERSGHFTVRVGDCLYMWGGLQPDLPEVHNDERKKSMCSVVEVCHLPTGIWEQKPTSGDPPLGVNGYAAAAIRNEIFFYGGACNHDDCYHNSVYSFNVDTLNWRELSPTTSHDGPMMKSFCGMTVLQINDEDYLAVVGGSRKSSSNTPKQPGAQYKGDLDGFFKCSEIHLYQVSSCKWISPIITGDRLPPIDSFSLTSLDNKRAILFGGSTAEGISNKLYMFNLSQTLEDISITVSVLPNPKGSTCPEQRFGHSSVLIIDKSGPQLLVVGGHYAYDCWIFDINKRIWKQLSNIPKSISERRYHSLSVWNMIPTMIEFGGRKKSEESQISDMRVFELKYSVNNDWSIDEIPQDQYQERLKERLPEDRRETEWLKHYLQERERELQERERELHEERREKKQLETRLETRLQQELQEKMRLQQERDRLLQEKKEELQEALQKNQEKQEKEREELQKQLELVQLENQERKKQFKEREQIHKKAQQKGQEQLHKAQQESKRKEEYLEQQLQQNQKQAREREHQLEKIQQQAKQQQQEQAKERENERQLAHQKFKELQQQSEERKQQLQEAQSEVRRKDQQIKQSQKQIQEREKELQLAGEEYKKKEKNLHEQLERERELLKESQKQLKQQIMSLQEEIKEMKEKNKERDEVFLAWTDEYYYYY